MKGRAGLVSLLGLAPETLPLATAYCSWVGIDTIGTVMAGIWRHGEPASLLRMACAGLIGLGIVGLKLTAAA